MNCNTFKKKLYDYMEESVVHDMKEAMEKHIEECSGCKYLYEEEIRLDEALRNAFKVENVNFSSSRAAIIKSIDKNKYSNDPVNKASYHMRKYQMRYIASAAVLLMAFMMAPYISSIKNGSKSEGSGMKIASDQGKAGIMSMEGLAKGTAESASLKSGDMVAHENMDTQKAREKVVYIPKLEKRERKEAVIFARPWSELAGTKLKATVDGRGDKAQEQGDGTIVVMNAETNKMYELYLVDNQAQYAPTFVTWFDSNNLLAVINYSQGRVTHGGDLYLLNLNTLKATAIYETYDYNEQITRAEFTKGKGILNLEVVVYEDDFMNNYRTENRVITFKDVTGDVKQPEVKHIYEFTDNIKYKKYSTAIQSMTGSFQMLHEGKLGNINNIQSMNIKKLIDVTEPYIADATTKQSYEFKIYYAEVEYKTENQKEPVSNGTYYQKIVLVKESKDSTWQLSDIVILPQS